jgi:hypothetical protein
MPPASVPILNPSRIAVFPVCTSINLATLACTDDNYTDDDQKGYSSALESVAAEMTPQQAADAQALARDWKTTFRK